MEEVSSSLGLGIGRVFDLVPNRRRLVRICLPLGHDAFEIQPLRASNSSRPCSSTASTRDSVELLAGMSCSSCRLRLMSGCPRRSFPLSHSRSANNSTLSRVFAVQEHGRELFEAAQPLDIEGIVAKRKADPYLPEVAWYKVKNPAYTQAEGRGDLFHKPR
jgi:hypothetical protein